MAKKYFKRKKANGTVFYVDESGKEVSEQVAKTNLVQRVNLVESTGRARVHEYPSLEKQLHDMSAENLRLKEKLKESGSASATKARTEQARTERKTELKEAAVKQWGYSEKEAEIFAQGRRR